MDDDAIENVERAIKGRKKDQSNSGDISCRTIIREWKMRTKWVCRGGGGSQRRTEGRKNIGKC